MPGLDSLCGVWNTKVVRGRPREAEAQELLKKIADQVYWNGMKGFVARARTVTSGDRLPLEAVTSPHLVDFMIIPCSKVYLYI